MGNSLIVGDGEAPVIGIGNKMYGGKFCGNKGGASIRGGIVHDENLPGAAGLSDDRCEARADEIGGVIGNDDDGYVHSIKLFAFFRGSSGISLLLFEPFFPMYNDGMFPGRLFP